DGGEVPSHRDRAVGHQRRRAGRQVDPDQPVELGRQEHRRSGAHRLGREGQRGRREQRRTGELGERRREQRRERQRVRRGERNGWARRREQRRGRRRRRDQRNRGGRKHRWCDREQRRGQRQRRRPRRHPGRDGSAAMNLLKVRRRPEPAVRIRERDRRLAWRVAALLLDYPGESLLVALDDLSAAVAELPDQVRLPLEPLITHLRSTPPLTLAADYVATFDLRKRASLHLTYYAYGDTRK